MHKALICFGTRPEAIKLAPVVKELSKRTEFEVRVCVTAQHREMLDQVLELFEIKPDYDLNLMSPKQSLGKLTATIVESVDRILTKDKPDIVIVQGDTTTTFSVALAAFYRQIKVAHVEAGLRTYQKYAPFPEEMNRKITSCLTDWHFVPTDRARDALLKENYPPHSIFTVGNSVIDALLMVVKRAREQETRIIKELPAVKNEGRILLVTGHRRENFGKGFENICRAIRRIAEDNLDLQIVYPVHLNPNVQEPVNRILGDLKNVVLLEPLDYVSFVWLMDRCSILLTDSGGVQEEAPTLGKPVIVMRNVTERPEAVEAGVAELVGTDPERIRASVQTLLDNEAEYRRMSCAQNPYGDGTSASQIADIIATNRLD
ncbi:MAG: UDP-N-acetylglucosamine 2-epimerase (non-hydrolyzing) [Proteobacteria bacterium]|nr:UDP-N-acetylglucosamine 2-epimerase (non-hydrolyzing) [Pseudomonadota bacterium]